MEYYPEAEGYHVRHPMRLTISGNELEGLDTSIEGVEFIKVEYRGNTHKFAITSISTKGDGRSWYDSFEICAQQFFEVKLPSKEERQALDAVKKAEESLKAAKKTLEAVKNKH